MHDTPATIRRFLGPAALDFGPFGLLGLDPRHSSGAGVEAALQQQLDRVAAHAEGDTPGADEVRLALHAAAAQLLDPRVREHLAARWRDEAQRREATERSGAHTLAADEAAGPSRAQPPSSPNRHPPELLRPRRRDDGAAKFIVAAAVLAVALIGIVIGGVIIFAPRPAPAPPVPGPVMATGPANAPPVTGGDTDAPDYAEAAASASAIDGPSASPSTDAANSSRTAFVDPRKSLKDLRDAVSLARTDSASAVTQLIPVLQQLADWWASYDPGLRRAADDAVIEAIYALAPTPELQCQVHDFITEVAFPLAPTEPDSLRRRLHANDVWPAAWGTGILTRLSRERDLPTRLVARTSATLDIALGTDRPTLEATFEAGAAQSLRKITLLILTDPKARPAGREGAAGPGGSTAAAKRWHEACTALLTDESAQERLLCDGLEHILISAREPEEDLGVFEAISLIAERIKWRANGPARPRLLDWFRDARISESDLRVVTAAIAGRSGAENVTSSMILSVNPAIDDRSRLRAKYAEAWSIESAGGDRASQRWLDAAKTLLGNTPSKSMTDTLRDTAAFARLNEAARLLWRGEGDAADSLLADTESSPTLGTLIAPQPTAQHFFSFHITGKGIDGTWAERYFAAERSIPGRIQLLAELEQGGRPIGAVDAAILVQEAVIGSPIQIRFTASRLAGQWADEPSVVSSSLDELPLAPRTRTTTEMYERITRQSLPPLTDPDWELTVRRALVERLLGMLASGTPEASMEHFAALIADSYLRASGQEPARGGNAAAEGARRGSEQLWIAVRAEAEAVAPVSAAPIPLDQIDRRRTGRRTLARGPAQSFAAEQVSIAEAMAYVVAGEKPTAAKRIDAAISRMQTARRNAGHVFEQLIATERTVLELWLLRFDQEPGGAI